MGIVNPVGLHAELRRFYFSRNFMQPGSIPESQFAKLCGFPFLWDFVKLVPSGQAYVTRRYASADWIHS
jgi:hypothetical protein